MAESHHGAALALDEASEKDDGDDGEEEVANTQAVVGLEAMRKGQFLCKGQSQCEQKSAMFRKGVFAFKGLQRVSADIDRHVQAKKGH